MSDLLRKKIAEKEAQKAAIKAEKEAQKATATKKDEAKTATKKDSKEPSVLTSSGVADKPVNEIRFSQAYVLPVYKKALKLAAADHKGVNQHDIATTALENSEILKPYLAKIRSEK